MSNTMTRDSGRRYIPTNAASFLGFMQSLLDYLTETRRIDWNIPVNVYQELMRLWEIFHTFQTETPIDATRAQIERRNEAQRELTKYLRYFIKFYLRNPIVPDADLKAMGIPPIDTIRTMHTVVNETVDFNIHIRGTNNVIIDFKQTGAQGKAKPKGYSGAVIIWALSDVEPATNDDYTGHTLATKTPYTIEFDTHDSGKRVWVRA